MAIRVVVAEDNYLAREAATRLLEGGIRTASLQAKTDVRVAVASADQIDRDALVDLREQRRR